MTWTLLKYKSHSLNSQHNYMLKDVRKFSQIINSISYPIGSSTATFIPLKTWKKHINPTLQKGTWGVSLSSMYPLFQSHVHRAEVDEQNTHIYTLDTFLVWPSALYIHTKSALNRNLEPVCLGSINCCSFFNFFKQNYRQTRCKTLDPWKDALCPKGSDAFWSFRKTNGLVTWNSS